MLGWAGTREELWQTAEAAEQRSNSRVAREVQIALPAELAERERWRLTLELAAWMRARWGVAVDASMHAAGNGRRRRPGAAGANVHAHLLFTTRRVQGRALTTKTRELDDLKKGPAEVEAIRAAWAEMTNAALARHGSQARIDHRSYERRGRPERSTHMPRAAFISGRGDGWDQLRAEMQTRRVRSAAVASRQIDQLETRETLSLREVQLLERKAETQARHDAARRRALDEIEKQTRAAAKLARESPQTPNGGRTTQTPKRRARGDPRQSTRKPQR